MEDASVRDGTHSCRKGLCARRPLAAQSGLASAAAPPRRQWRRHSATTACRTMHCLPAAQTSRAGSSSEIRAAACCPLPLPLPRLDAVG
eukprot:363433-Chlamydomonas_euryale.AAC.2